MLGLDQASNVSDIFACKQLALGDWLECDFSSAKWDCLRDAVNFFAFVCAILKTANFLCPWTLPMHIGIVHVWLCVYVTVYFLSVCWRPLTMFNDVKNNRFDSLSSLLFVF